MLGWSLLVLAGVVAGAACSMMTATRRRPRRHARRLRRRPRSLPRAARPKCRTTTYPRSNRCWRSHICPIGEGRRRQRARVGVDEDPTEEVQHERDVIGAQQRPRRVRRSQVSDLVGSTCRTGRRLSVRRYRVRRMRSPSSIQGPNYALTAVVCDDDDSVGDLATRSVHVNVSAGEHVTCVFTNTDQRLL